MEKLKCESCGANLEIDENNEYATCKYCNLKYKLKKDVNLNISLDEETKNIINPNGFKTTQGKIISIIAIIIFIIIAFVFVKVFTSFGSNSSNYNEESFNSKYEMYSGTQSKFFMEEVFNDVATNNKKNSDKKITVVYNDITTSNSDEITDLYDKLEDKDYKVVLDYNDKGYVNKITLKD